MFDSSPDEGRTVVTEHPSGVTSLSERVATNSAVAKRGGMGARSSFPGWVPRAVKRKAGRTDVPLIPAHIRVFGTHFSRDDRMRLRKSLGMKLSKFASAIERVTVRVKDVNGPRGGVDHVCRIKTVLSGLPSVVFEAQDASLDAAIARSVAGAGRAVRRSLQRRRMKPIKAGARLRVDRPRQRTPRRAHNASPPAR